MSNVQKKTYVKCQISISEYECQYSSFHRLPPKAENALLPSNICLEILSIHCISVMDIWLTTPFKFCHIKFVVAHKTRLQSSLCPVIR